MVRADRLVSHSSSPARWRARGARATVVAAALALAAGCARPQREVDRAPRPPRSGPPDLVLIVADDLRPDVLGPAGHPVVRTPHIDRLAAGGAWFENAFVVSPQCSPSRATILTGTHLHVHGVHDNAPGRSMKEPTVAEILHGAGYETAFVGKWHIGERWEPQPGFDRWVAFEGQGEYFDVELNVDGEIVRSRGYSTEVLTDYAVRWLERERVRPSLLVLALKSVHRPLEPPRRDRRRYARAAIELPASFHDPIEEIPVPEERDRVDPHFLGGEGGTSDEAMREEIRAYWRMVPAVDRSIGRVLDALERRGSLDSTAVLFTSDSGFLLGEHGLFLKGRGYDPAIRVPLVLRYPPRVGRGLRPAASVLNLDIAPTLLDLAGRAAPPEMSGRSLLPLLEGSTTRLRESWLYVQPYRRAPSATGVRTEGWKYLFHPKSGGGELLFDLVADPEERTNLAGLVQSEARLSELRGELRRLLEREGAPADWGPAPMTDSKSGPGSAAPH